MQFPAAVATFALTTESTISSTTTTTTTTTAESSWIALAAVAHGQLNVCMPVSIGANLRQRCRGVTTITTIAAVAVAVTITITITTTVTITVGTHRLRSERPNRLPVPRRRELDSHHPRQ